MIYYICSRSLEISDLKTEAAMKKHFETSNCWKELDENSNETIAVSIYIK